MQQLAADEATCASLMATMQRRGPDQSGVWRGGPATLLHARLCVVDIQHGRQPFVLQQPDGETYVLVHNDELYNTEELRTELAEQGHRFTGHSDTEMLAHAYAEWGEDCLPKLNGIFAFAVWEQQAQRLFIARDRIGVKPLFYSRPGGGFVFASEIKTLLAHPQIPAQVSREGVLEVMLIGPGRTPGCGVFQGIAELEPGCCGYYSRDGLRTWRYWALEDRKNTDSFSDAV